MRGRRVVVFTILALGAASCLESTAPLIPAQVIKTAGDAQTGAAGEILPQPLQVQVADSAGRGVPGATVTFAASSGSGGLLAARSDSTGATAATLAIQTDSQGVARAYWMLGPLGGGQQVTATAEGVGAVSFMATSHIVATSLSAGWGYTCALSIRGVAYCWGDDPNGSMPHVVDSTLRFTRLSAGERGACGISSDGVTYCWGVNDFGQSGNGTTDSSATPVPVSGSHSFREIYSSDFFTCALTNSGAAYCWGENASGQLGDSTETNRLTPVPVHGGLLFTSLALEYRSTCGVTLTERLYCWGDASFSITPQPVEPDTLYDSVAVAIWHRCAIAAGGTSYCWGGNGFGQLGNGTLTSSATPVPVSTGTPFVQLTTDWYHTCGLTAAGVAYCWGRNANGALGIGSGVDSATVPTHVAGGLTFTSLTAATDRTCGLTMDGAAYCWGWNNRGANGDGTTTDSPVPVRVAMF